MPLRVAPHSQFDKKLNYETLETETNQGNFVTRQPPFH